MALGLLAGCASTPSPVPRFQEARSLIDRARSAHSPAADAKIADAEGALEYAELEYRNTPNHPLSSARADNALAKARVAYNLAYPAPAAPAPQALPPDNRQSFAANGAQPLPANGPQPLPAGGAQPLQRIPVNAAPH